MVCNFEDRILVSNWLLLEVSLLEAPFDVIWEGWGTFETYEFLFISTDYT
jgi:hypothetical protein